MKVEIKVNGRVLKTLEESNKQIVGLVFEDCKRISTMSLICSNTVEECLVCIEDALDYIADLYNDEADYLPSTRARIQETTDFLEGLSALLESCEKKDKVSCEVDEASDNLINESYCWLNNLLKGYYNQKFIEPELENQILIFKATFERQNRKLFEFLSPIERFQLGKNGFIKTTLVIKENLDNEELFGKLSEIFQPFEVDFSILGINTVELFVSEKELLKIFKKNLWIKGSFTTKKHETLSFYLWNDSEVIANQLKEISDEVIYGNFTDWANKEILSYAAEEDEIVISDKKYDAVKKAFPYVKSPKVDSNNYIFLSLFT